MKTVGRHVTVKTGITEWNFYRHSVLRRVQRQPRGLKFTTVENEMISKELLTGYEGGLR